MSRIIGKQRGDGNAVSLLQNNIVGTRHRAQSVST